MELLLIFGLWMNLSTVNFLDDTYNDRCVVAFNDEYKTIRGHDCNEVAAAINAHLKLKEKN